jgi:hypothetical protein
MKGGTMSAALIVTASPAMTEGEWRKVTKRASRFWPRVQMGAPDECWEWTGPRLKNGHGRYDSTVSYVAHRYAWILANGRIPLADEVIRHQCDNPPCCNPSHLLAGTQKQNVADMIDRGRGTFQRDQCRKGHALTPDNSMPHKNGTRRCRICATASQSNAYDRRGKVECPDCRNQYVYNWAADHMVQIHGYATRAEARMSLRAAGVIQ